MTELRQREPRDECPAFLVFVRRKACCACGAPAPSQAAHVRMGCREWEKRPTGIGEKPSDRWCVPLCSDCHLDVPDAQHRVGERKFWARVGKDPFEIAARLWAQFWRRRDRSPEERDAVVARAARIKRRRKRLKNDTGSRSSVFPKRPSPVKRIAGSKIQSANRWPPKGSRPFRSS